MASLKKLQLTVPDLASAGPLIVGLMTGGFK